MDGNSADWAGLDYFSDPIGDNAGGPAYDIRKVSTAIDREYAYLMVETSGKPFSTDVRNVEVNYDYKPGRHFLHDVEAFADLHTNIKSNNTMYAWTDVNFDWIMEDFPITGYSVVRGNVLELRIPLSQLEYAYYFNVTFINIWDPHIGQPGNDPTFICLN